MYEQFPNLLIKNLEGGNLLLETVDCGESYMVEVHPSQVRLMAEYLGIVRPPPVPDDDEPAEGGELVPTLAKQGTSSPVLTHAELARDVARLQHYLLSVQAKAVQLQDYINDCSDWKHADLTGEALRVAGIVDMLDLVCAEFDDQLPGSDEPSASRPATNTPENGAVEQPQKRGRSTPEQMTIEGAGDEQ